MRARPHILRIPTASLVLFVIVAQILAFPATVARAEDGRGLRYRLHWEGGGGGCTVASYGYMDLDPRVREDDPYGCASFDDPQVPSVSRGFFATEGVPFVLDATRPIEASLALRGDLWLNTRLAVRVTARIGGRWIDLGHDVREVPAPSGDVTLVFRLEPRSRFHERVIGGLRFTVSKVSGHASGWIDLPEVEIVIPTDDGRGAKTSAPSGIPSSERIETWTYVMPGGPLCPRPYPLGFVEHACVVIDAFPGERRLEVAANDVTGLPVPGVVAYWDGSLWQVFGKFCGESEKPFRIAGRSAVAVAVYETAPWDTTGCVGAATTGTVEAVLSSS